MITNRELTAQDWHCLNGLLATALGLEPRARVDWLAALADERPRGTGAALMLPLTAVRQDQ